MQLVILKDGPLEPSLRILKSVITKALQKFSTENNRKIIFFFVDIK